MSGPPFERVAVTGASGRLGRWVVRELAGDFEVRAIDLEPPGGDVPFARADVRDIDAVRGALEGCDAAVHLAALDAGAVPEEEAFIDVNPRGAWNVLQASEELGLGRVVLASSVAAVGLDEDNPPRGLPVPVDAPLAPRSAYGVSKLVCEEFARTFARRGSVETICLRPALVAQPDIAWSMAAIAAAMEGADPPPPAAGRGWRDLREPLSPTRAFVSPGDAARAFRAALEVRGLRFGVYFVTGPDTCALGPTVDLVARGFGVAPEVARPSLYADDPRASAYDLAPALRDLGWAPRDRWADHLARVVAGAEAP